MAIFAANLISLQMEQSLHIAQLSGIKRFSFDYSKLGDSYMFSHFVPGDTQLDYFTTPIRFDGFLIVLCLKGRIDMEVNLEHLTIESGSLLCVGPDRIISTKENDLSDFEAYFLFISPQFLRDINIDINILNSAGKLTTFKAKSRSPLMNLTTDESKLLQKYMELLHYNTVDNSTDLYIKSIARNIIASMIYQVMQFATKRAPEEEPERPRSRRANYVHEFMQLVHMNYRQERSVGFYASKLFISPKYLSLIIKEVTGRSAAEWIDERVILEAKNLLRYSGKNIQQVAYELNFTNQSSFGKYFKHLTGMSPSEFQKS